VAGQVELPVRYLRRQYAQYTNAILRALLLLLYLQYRAPIATTISKHWQ
jgi:hypothetical protein